MNTGIGDAFNLGWKLKLLTEGLSNPELLLSSYNIERRHVAQDVVTQTDRFTQMITLKQPLAQTIRNKALSFLTSFEFVQDKIKLGMSQLGVNYCNLSSPLVVNPSTSYLSASGWSAQYQHESGSRLPDCVLENNVRLYSLIKNAHGKFVVFFFCIDVTVENSLTHPSYNIVERYALQLSFRYSKFAKVFVLVPSAVYQNLDATQKNYGGEFFEFYSLNSDLTTQFQLDLNSRSVCGMVVRPDLYIGIRAQSSPTDHDLDKLVKYFEMVTSKN